MREDWDRRAREDAEYYIYTRDPAKHLDDFSASGQANYNQLVRPFLPMMLNGQPAHSARVVEIGCGLGRMTSCFARDFGFVEALDVSPEMIDGARRRLDGLSNVGFHIVSGRDLAPIADGSADLVFSYIVFQHIPSREVIESYVGEAARVLKESGVLKFQVNGDQSPEYLDHPRDTWLGETLSEAEARAMLVRWGFSAIALEGVGTQYFVITARKGESPRQRPYVLPGEPWAAPLLVEGFGPPVERSWRPVSANARVRLEGQGSHLYLGLYFWPESCHHQLTLAGHTFDVTAPGDHYFECTAKLGSIEFEIRIEPPPTRAPAFRILGLY